MKIRYFQADHNWNKDKAESFAKSIGLHTKYENGELFIEAKWKPLDVLIEEGPVYSGYVRLMNSWNGWEIPVFEKDVAEKIMQEYADEFKWDGENIMFHSKNYESEPPETIEPFTIQVDGVTKTVYDFSLGWCWQKNTEENETDNL